MAGGNYCILGVTYILRDRNVLMPEYLMPMQDVCVTLDGDIGVHGLIEVCHFYLSFDCFISDY